MLQGPSSRRTVSQSHRWAVEVVEVGKQQQGSYWKDGLGSLWGLMMTYWIGDQLTRLSSLEDGTWKGKVSCIEAADHCKDSGDNCTALGHCRTGSRKMIAVEVLRLLPSGAAVVDSSKCRTLLTVLSTWKNPSGLQEVDSKTMLSYCFHLTLTNEPLMMTTDVCPMALSLRVYEH